MRERQVEKDARSLKQRLDLLIAQDSEMETFGASGYQDCHQFRLGKPLTEEAISEFESIYTVRLPEEYRAFLKHVGNGGAGPGFGVEPLSSAAPNGGESQGERSLAAQFPYTRAVRIDLEAESRLESEYEGDFPGCLYLSDLGCGIHGFLVVTGPCRGQVWTDETSNGRGIWPTAFHFNAWYSEWLDQAFLQLYSKKLDRLQEVQFAMTSPERFRQYLTTIERLKAGEGSGGLRQSW